MATDGDHSVPPGRVRREPPPPVPVSVVERTELSPRMLRITFHGDGLSDLVIDRPAMSIRLLVPTPGTDELVMPEWNGNEFLLPDGSRPALRTFTPLRADTAAGTVDVEVVRHPGGAVSEWAESVTSGAPAAISGPGTGFDYPANARQLVVLADETALPAALQVAESAPGDLRVSVHVEVVTTEAVQPVELADRHTLEWHVTASGEVPGGRMAELVESFDALPDDVHIWAAGEASAMHRIRTHLFDTLGAERKRATVRGYWKPARR